MTFGDQCKGYHHHIPYSVYAYNRYICIYIQRERSCVCIDHKSNNYNSDSPDNAKDV